MSDAQAFWLDQLGEADRFTQWVFELLAPHLRGRVLEVGCGTGTYTRLIATLAEQVTAVDLDEGFVDACRRATAHLGNVQARCADATTADLGAQYDTVVLLDILEHIEADAQMLARLARLLRPGGLLAIKVPALPALYSPLDRSIGHHRRYDRRSLQAVVAEAGFELLEMRYFNTLGVAGWFWNGVVMRRQTPPAQQIGFFNRVVPTLRAIERAWAPPFGLSLVAFARRT